jgi:succinate-semialdehyde dehydrogenase/glutarate-semialdehyde dehydrogenase
VAGGGTFEVHDRANGTVISRVSDGGADDAGQAAATDWASRTTYDRSAFLYAAQSLMLERSEDLAKLMTTEQGKPLRAARTEVKYAADFLIWFAEEAKRVYRQVIPSPRADQRLLVLHQPVGVVRAITPWNYPSRCSPASSHRCSPPVARWC